MKRSTLKEDLEEVNNEMNLLKNDFEKLSSNDSKFNKGKENLSILINSSKPSFNKNDLSFVNKQTINKNGFNYV